jgi:hypothetical protein
MSGLKVPEGLTDHTQWEEASKVPDIRAEAKAAGIPLRKGIETKDTIAVDFDGVIHGYNGGVKPHHLPMFDP